MKSKFQILVRKLGSGSSRRGFTLIELAMAMGLMTVLIVIMTGIFGSIIDAGLASNATSGVDQDGRFILTRLIYDMQRASQIVTPAVPSSMTSPTLTITTNSVNYTYSLNGNGNMQINDGSLSDNLNGYTTQVSNLSFQRIGVGNLTDTVQVKFNVVSRIRDNSGFETKNFQTTLGLQ